MKMDFPHLGEVSPGERSRARYAELVANAANRQFAHLRLRGQAVSGQKPDNRFDQLDARIGFFALAANRAKSPAYGAFLPRAEKSAVVERNCKKQVNLSDSTIGKPNFLGSRYPGRPETLRGMEN